MKPLLTSARQLGAAALLGAVLIHAPNAAAAPTLLDYVAGTVVQDSAGYAIDVKQQLSSQAARNNTTSEYSEVASSQANLQDGTVKVRNVTRVTDSAQAYGAFATGLFGDGFQHVSGSGPFDWTGQTARFSIAIDGLETIQPGTGQTYNFAMAFLVVYRAGTLDNFMPFCNGTVNDGHVYDNVVAGFFWSIGDGVDHPCGGTFNGNLSGNVDTTLTADFQPGGDFDWVFGVRLGGAVNANLGLGERSSAYWEQDFGSTATLSYEAPAGLGVISRSGAFPGTMALNVPEPGTLALAALGLAVAGIGRRGGKSA